MRIFLTCLLLMAAGSATAQHNHGDQNTHSPYTDIQDRAIKALSQAEIDDLMAGNGMGFALAAELNGIPGPKHVLELESELSLTAEQKAATEALFARMNEAARTLGASLIAAERHLDSGFAERSLDADALERMTTHIGQMRGQLRAIHLGAHLEMMDILSDDQVHAYNMARGYHEGH